MWIPPAAFKRAASLSEHRAKRGERNSNPNPDLAGPVLDPLSYRRTKPAQQIRSLMHRVGRSIAGLMRSL
jgi:hypothetical protein